MSQLHSLKNGHWHIGDCLEVMKQCPDGIIDMILCDLPYGTTACAWDTVIPFEPLWEQYWRICKPNAAIVLTASQPFTTALIYSAIDYFRYEIIWQKERSTNFLQGKRQILKYHENICVFYKKQPCYNPQLTEKLEKNKRNNSPRGMANQVYGQTTEKYSERTTLGGNKNWLYPSSVQKFSMQRGLHPTQKPVALFEYLIRTYTNEGNLVLDNCAGSGTTAIACENANRQWVCIEQSEEYSAKAIERIRSHTRQSTGVSPSVANDPIAENS